MLILSNGDAIVASTFLPPRRDDERLASDALLGEAIRQVRAYFHRRLRRFDLPLRLDGSDFQTAVWRAVERLAFGEFVAYAEVARAVGRPSAHRGVAAAMAATPIDLFIPAHRVIGADGKIKGADPASVRFRLAEFELAGPPAMARNQHSRPSRQENWPDKR